MFCLGFNYVLHGDIMWGFEGVCVWINISYLCILFVWFKFIYVIIDKRNKNKMIFMHYTL